LGVQKLCTIVSMNEGAGGANREIDAPSGWNIRRKQNVSMP